MIVRRQEIGGALLFKDSKITMFSRRCSAYIGAILISIAPPAIAQQATIQETGWGVSCLEPGFCELKNEIIAGGDVAARMSVIKHRGEFLLRYTIPLGVDFTVPVQLKVDEGTPIESEILNCTFEGCFGSATMTSDILQAMKQGQTLFAIFRSPQTMDILVISFGLAGFTAKYAEMTAR